MFIVKFWGGLGNQMFEYALFKQLEKRFPTSVIRAHIPFRPSKEYNLASYCLDNVFNIQIKECSWKTVAKLSDIYPEDGPLPHFFNPLAGLSRCIMGHKSTYIVQDDFTCFYPEVYNLSPLHSYYLVGAWANYNYLTGVEEILQGDFRFDDNFSDRNKFYKEAIINSNSVSIHIRRGDFIKDGCSLVHDDYYFNAIKAISERIENPSFFVFSDDHEYCNQLFNGKVRYELVTGNIGSNSYRDMQLMSLCKHNIIGNSTFSFWGAYLNKNSNKIVISPNLGVGVAEHNIPFTCPGWIKIDV